LPWEPPLPGISGRMPAAATAFNPVLRSIIDVLE
jgi:hypothetical protein